MHLLHTVGFQCLHKFITSFLAILNQLTTTCAINTFINSHVATKLQIKLFQWDKTSWFNLLVWFGSSLAHLYNHTHIILHKQTYTCIHTYTHTQILPTVMLSLGVKFFNELTHFLSREVDWISCEVFVLQVCEKNDSVNLKLIIESFLGYR